MECSFLLTTRPGGTNSILATHRDVWLVEKKKPFLRSGRNVWCRSEDLNYAPSHHAIKESVINKFLRDLPPVLHEKIN